MIKNNLFTTSHNSLNFIGLPKKANLANANINGLKLNTLTTDKVSFGKSFEPVDDIEASTVGLYNKINPSIVSLKLTNKKNFPGGVTKDTPLGYGSGFIIENGYIVTNAHVIVKDYENYNKETDKDASNNILTATLNDGRTYTVSVVGKDILSDIALLRIDANTDVIKELKPIETGDYTVAPGQRVFAFGTPLGLKNMITQGIVGARSIQGEEKGNRIPLSISLNPGNSGGAAIDSRGNLFGVITAKVMGDGLEGIGFAIPIKEVLSLVQELKSNGDIERPDFGIKEALFIKELPDVTKENLGLSGINNGLMIQELDSVGILAKNNFCDGLLMKGKRTGNEIKLGGDIITKINDIPINSKQELVDAIKSCRKEKPITIQYISLERNQNGNKPIFIASKVKTRVINEQ